jgi:hypothetical protein
MDSATTAQGFIPMWQTTHLLTGLSALQLVPLLRAMQRHARHAWLAKFSDPATTQTLLLTVATILFVLACVGLTLVGGVHAH